MWGDPITVLDHIGELFSRNTSRHNRCYSSALFVRNEGNRKCRESVGFRQTISKIPQIHTRWRRQLRPKMQYVQ